MARLMHYVLVGQTPVPEPDIEKWAIWFGQADRIVAQTEIGASVVSTVFLGIDHQWGTGPPLLYETMIFTDGAAEDFQRRCSTWLQAEAQHRHTVETVRSRRGSVQPD